MQRRFPFFPLFRSRFSRRTTVAAATTLTAGILAAAALAVAVFTGAIPAMAQQPDPLTCTKDDPAVAYGWGPGPPPSDTTKIVEDCTALLHIAETLKGTGGALNWSRNVSMLAPASNPTLTVWEGIDIGEDPNLSREEYRSAGGSGGLCYIHSDPDCRPTGVFSNDNGHPDADRVKNIILSPVLSPAARLNGTLPAASATHSFGDLEALQQLIIIDYGQLTGGIPSDLTSTNLKVLRLSRNGLSGAVPAGVLGMTTLTDLRLDGNEELNGPITGVGNATSLEHLDLQDNKFSGAIPTGLGSASGMKWLYLNNNALSGSIPAELGNLGALVHLELQHNRFTGALPTGLGNMGKPAGSRGAADPSTLTRLRINNNDLYGAIPADLGNLNGLTHLIMSYNQLGWDGNTPRTYSGTIPSSLGGLTNLQELRLNWNQLTGAPPAQLANMSSLVILDLSDNRLSGLLPDLSSLSGTLTHLLLETTRSGSLGYNQLNGGGSIPTWLGSMSSLKRLTMGHNAFGGAIPTSPTLNWAGMTSLEYLFVNNNGLTGTIPAGDLDDLTSLKGLNLSGNGLSGSIPAEFGNMTGLIGLYLNSNGLTGAIPADLSSMSSLQELHLNRNRLSGAIPDALGNMAALQELDLDHNGLTSWTIGFAKTTGISGSIPSALCNLTTLRELRLSNNQITGSIPGCLGNMPNLEDLRAYGNGLRVSTTALRNDAHPGLSGTIPAQLGNSRSLKILLLEDNSLEGSIPRELGNISSLENVTLYSNQLTGGIPTQLGNLSNLRRLRLDDNRLTGTIPTQLGNLVNMESLTLNDNQLTGTIPSSLSNMGRLQYLWLQNNQLTGEIPDSFASAGWYPWPASGNDCRSPAVCPALRTRIDMRGNELTGRVLLSWTPTASLGESDADQTYTVTARLAPGAEMVAWFVSNNRQAASGLRLTAEGTVPDNAAGTTAVGFASATSAAFNIPRAAKPPNTDDTTTGTGTITINPTENSRDNLDEQVKLNVTGTGAPGVADLALFADPVNSTITLTDDDAREVLLFASPNPVNEDATGGAVITAKLSQPSTGQTTITVAAAPMPPAVAADYTQSGSSLHIPANALDSVSPGAVRIAGVPDILVGINRVVRVSVSAAVNPAETLNLAHGQVDLTIQEDDKLGVRLRASPVAIAENGGTSAITAWLTEPTDGVVSVVVTVQPVAPAVAADYVLTGDTTLTVPVGDTASSGAITVTAVDNEEYAPDKSLTLSATASSVGTTPLEDSVPSLTLFIENDDARPVVIRRTRTPTPRPPPTPWPTATPAPTPTLGPPPFTPPLPTAAAPAATPTPTPAAPTPTPTLAPTPTIEPTPIPPVLTEPATPTPVPDDDDDDDEVNPVRALPPTATPAPTAVPTATPAPTAAPTPRPTPTLLPTATPLPTPSPAPTLPAAPAPTAAPPLVMSPPLQTAPTATPWPTATVAPAPAAAAPSATATPAPTVAAPAPPAPTPPAAAPPVVDEGGLNLLLLAGIIAGIVLLFGIGGAIVYMVRR